MANEKDQRPKIEQPKPHRVADTGRAAVRGGLGAIPVAGSLAAEAANILMPDPTARDRERWEGDVTDGVNTLHGRVDDLDARTGQQSLTLTGATAYAAKFMVEQCPDGLMSEFVTIDDIMTAHPDLDRGALIDGLGDLESYGLIDTRCLINAPERYRLTAYGYEVLDPPIMGWNPLDDARALASISLKSRDGIRVSDLESETGWSRRRLNPALRIVLGFIDSGRVSQTIQPDYVARHFSPNNAERAALRRFAGEDRNQ